MSQSSAAARVPTRPIARPAARDRVQQPRLRVVAPAPRRSAGGLALLSVGLLGLGLLVLLLLNISIGKGAYALTELQRQQRQLAEDRQMLAEQVEAASAPDKLADRATKLGMVPNPSLAFLRVPNGKVQGRPEVATAPSAPALKSVRTAKKSAGAAAAAAAAGKKRVEQDAAAKKAADEKSARTGHKAGQPNKSQAAKRTEKTP